MTEFKTLSAGSVGGPDDNGPDQAVRDPGRAPDPRSEYGSPEELREDIERDIAEREKLLLQWKQDLDREIESESEGMSAQDPISADKEARLAAEERRVADALRSIQEERQDSLRFTGEN